MSLNIYSTTRHLKYCLSQFIYRIDTHACIQGYWTDRAHVKMKKTNECLLYIYWLPKFHKIPTKATSIIAAPKDSLKPLSESITAILKILHGFFVNNTFISITRLTLAKNQANAKQNPEAELLIFENYSLSSYTLSSRIKRRYSKNV